MRKVYDLTKEEYSTLLEMGFLFEFFPESTGSFENDVLNNKCLLKKLAELKYSVTDLFNLFEEYGQTLQNDRSDETYATDRRNWEREIDNFKFWLIDRLQKPLDK